MPWIIGAIVLAAMLSQCGTTSVKDDPLGLRTDKPSQEQMTNRQLYDQAVRQDMLESCLKYMQGKTGGDKRDCPK